jgi:hypothetical protein
MKFTDEELSRVLSAHEDGELHACGSLAGPRCCLIQAAFPGISLINEMSRQQLAAMSWFDGIDAKCDVIANLSTDELLHKIETECP